tara:strand:+ start:74 stop:490 length:417 start_codon:yes stop_codon:yes gene_type:complete
MASIIPALLQVAAAGQAASAHQASGEAEAQALRDKADSAESAAKDRELERLVKLRQVRSAQRAYWSAAGIDSATGSPMTVASRSYEMFELDQGADLINTRQQIRSYNNSADSAIRIGRIKARGSMLSGITGAANTWNS